MKRLHIFRDSYIMPYFCAEPEDSFWGPMAKELSVGQIINYNQSRMSFDQIIHLLLNESLDLKNNYFVMYRRCPTKNDTVST